MTDEKKRKSKILNENEKMKWKVKSICSRAEWYLFLFNTYSFSSKKLYFLSFFFQKLKQKYFSFVVMCVCIVCSAMKCYFNQRRICCISSDDIISCSGHVIVFSTISFFFTIFFSVFLLLLLVLHFLIGIETGTNWKKKLKHARDEWTNTNENRRKYEMEKK